MADDQCLMCVHARAHVTPGPGHGRPAHSRAARVCEGFWFMISAMCAMYDQVSGMSKEEQQAGAGVCAYACHPRTRSPQPGCECARLRMLVCTCPCPFCPPWPMIPDVRCSLAVPHDPGASPTAGPRRCARRGRPAAGGPYQLAPEVQFPLAPPLPHPDTLQRRTHAGPTLF